MRRPRFRESRFPIALAFAALVAPSVSGCRGDKPLLGNFGGDWDVGGGFMIVLADGGEADLIRRDAPEQGRVTITRKDPQGYAVRLETPSLTCTLSAHFDEDNGGKLLVLDGPGTSSRWLYRDVPAGEGAPWQVCRLDAIGFHGDVNVSGTVRAAGTDAISLKLWAYPRVADAVAGVKAGSAANGSFEGSRHR